MDKIIIDEKSGNPFPSNISLAKSLNLGFTHASSDGFYHNDEAIKVATQKLAQIAGLRPGQKTMDVGYGSNLSVALALRELGMEAFGLDSQDGVDYKRYPDAPCIVPPHFNTFDRGVRKYCGTIEDIFCQESELKNERFDLVSIWGGWESGGNNFAIGGEMSWFRAVKILERKHGPTYLEGGNWNPYHNPEVDDLIRRTKDKILDDCRLLLNPQGGILIVSSRYARHGGGFAFDQLPEEKRGYFELIKKFSDMKAHSVYAFGVSKTEVQRQLGGRYDTIAEALTLDKDEESNLPLGRIDAVYGKF